MKQTLQLPPPFIKRMQTLLGDEYARFEDSLKRPEPTSIRQHPTKGRNISVKGSPVAWEPLGVVLDERPVFALDPAWHAGAYYVQESSSMLTGAVLRNHIRSMPAPRILDACAAPGGKSTHLLSIMEGKGLLVANETVPKRNIVLTENIQKWGYANVVVTRESAAKLGQVEGYFDIVVVDAPCSGEGLFRREPQAIAEWSEQAVEACALRQKDILLDLIPALKVGGLLCYSTCTFETCENEAQIRMLLDSGLFELLPLDNPLFEGTEQGFVPGTLKCWPHKVNGSGFFIALLRKTGNEPNKPASSKTRNTNWKATKKAPQEMDGFVRQDEALTTWMSGESIRLFPTQLAHDLHWLLTRLQVLYFGVDVGKLNKGVFTPAHSLVHTDLIQGKIHRHDVDLETALQFLRKNPIPPAKDIKGWAVVRHEGHQLGWMKSMPDRINNYLPVDRMLRIWR